MITLFSCAQGLRRPGRDHALEPAAIGAVHIALGDRPARRAHQPVLPIPGEAGVAGAGAGREVAVGVPAQRRVARAERRVRAHRGRPLGGIGIGPHPAVRGDGVGAVVVGEALREARIAPVRGAQQTVEGVILVGPVVVGVQCCAQ